MKGAGTLVLLLSLAAVAGLVLVMTRGNSLTEEDPSLARRPPAEPYVEGAIGLPFRAAPVIETVSQEILLEQVGENLDARFGPGGLVRRTRALELLGFDDTAGRNLRDEMIALEAGGVRGWFDDRTGSILIPTNFDADDLYDRVVLHGLLTRLLLHQHAPPTIGRLTDDEWIARRGLHGAVAESVKAKLRQENREAFSLPTPIQTEREAVILGLPTWLHQVAQLPLERGPARIFFEARVRTGARGLGELVREPPRTTFELLGGDARSLLGPSPSLPDFAEVLLEESLGAFGVQALLEWLDDFEQAQALALLWRGDRYRLFADEGGDGLVWICHWATPAAAKRAGEILDFSQASAASTAEERRHRSVIVNGTATISANCASAAALAQLIEALEIPGSPDAPPP